MEPIIELGKINYKYQPDDPRPALKTFHLPSSKVSGSQSSDIMDQGNQHLQKQSMGCFYQSLVL